ELFASWGYEARVETYRALLPIPLERSLEMTAPRSWRARLEEPALAEDRTSGQKAEQLPTYNAYSPDGEVEAEVVYVNYGVPADYEELAQRGIDVRGKIVLARYGGSWRGIKPKVAAEHGAIGCLIFSDPGGDGFFEGPAWPEGGWRSEDSVQRGSILDMPLYSGDPLTPGRAATEDAERLPLDAVPVLPTIPTLPISAADAEPILRELGGPMAPEAWRGHLPLSYRLGPGPARVRLELVFDWGLRPVHDVIAVLPGAERPDEWVLRGNHHDAWVHGATDPVSGMVAVLAEAKAIGELAKAGFRPRRTLIFAAWDGEEQGLIGSTEWAEAHADELVAKAIAYVNSDSITRGFVNLAGSHSLEPFAHAAASAVADPATGAPVTERARARRIVEGDEKTRERARASAELEIGALGSGSDYTPFLQHLGLASLSLDFGGEEQYGQYHSIYDSIDHYERFGDPGFEYVATAAKVGARLVLRLSEATVLPFRLDRAAERIGRYAGEIHELADEKRKEAEERARRLEERSLVLAADPRETFVPPPPLAPVPFLELAPLDNAVARLGRAAEAFETARAGLDPASADPAVVDRVNAFLRGFERLLTSPEGLPGRPWYRHQIYAPGQYTGYGVKTLPAVREAIELRRWDEVDQRIREVAAVLDRAAAAIEAETAALSPPPPG
ncbi:MAG TPA: transferrin receptor-like dimerization domain-containing protein, partial [Thermoanaerobaculia bacterium]|nr:transferrin receptor-like dimerization domain-containing protein [Thermoanaerobaculia bacterium]